MSADVKFPELEQICKSIHVDSSQMSMNVHDQLFIARIFDMHYNSLLDDLRKEIKLLYDKQTKDLAEVIVTYHNDHIKEIKRISSGIKVTNGRLSKIEKSVRKHERQIGSIIEVIKELHGKEIKV